MDAAQPSRLARTKPLLLLAFATFFFHALVTGGHLQSPDEELMFRQAESIALRASTAITPLEANYATGLLPQGFPPEAAFATRLNHDGTTFHAQYLPLQPFLSAPFIYAGHALDEALGERFAAVLRPGMATSYVMDLPQAEAEKALFRRGLLVMLFNPLVSALSVLILARLGRLLTGSRAAGLWAAGLWAFGTVAWPHGRTYFTEPLAGLFAIAALDQLCRWHLKPYGEGTKHAVLLGVMLGLANLTRVDAPFFTVGMIAAMAGLGAWKYLRAEVWAEQPKALPWFPMFLAGSIPLGAWIALQTFNTLRFGGDITSGYGDQTEGVKFTTPLLIGLHGLLFSPGKGLFFFSPAVLLGLWGWCLAPRQFNWLKWTTLLAYLPFTIAMVKWQNWDGGWCWGPRHIVQIHLPLMLGAVFLFAQPLTWARRTAIGALAVIGIVVQLYGSSQDALQYYREYFMTYTDGEYHRVNYTPLQLQNMEERFMLTLREEDGSAGTQTPFGNMPAPMIDSLYLPQHTQWYSYATMWQLGHCDWFWWNAVSGAEHPRWDSMP